MAQPAEIKEPEVTLNPVHGIMPDSRNEYFFALALDQLKYEYLFQKQIGMAGIRGSQVIDFVVFYGAASIACFIQGSYWHKGNTESEDTLKHLAAEHIYGRGNVRDFTEEETSSVDSCVRAIKEKL